MSIGSPIGHAEFLPRPLVEPDGPLGRLAPTTSACPRRSARRAASPARGPPRRSRCTAPPCPCARIALARYARTPEAGCPASRATSNAARAAGGSSRTRALSTAAPAPSPTGADPQSRRPRRRAAREAPSASRADSSSGLGLAIEDGVGTARLRQFALQALHRHEDGVDGALAGAQRELPECARARDAAASRA